MSQGLHLSYNSHEKSCHQDEFVQEGTVSEILGWKSTMGNFKHEVAKRMYVSNLRKFTCTAKTTLLVSLPVTLMYLESLILLTGSA